MYFLFWSMKYNQLDFFLITFIFNSLKYLIYWKMFTHKGIERQLGGHRVVLLWRQWEDNLMIVKSFTFKGSEGTT
jgi:hypothetical protein